MIGGRLPVFSKLDITRAPPELFRRGIFATARIVGREMFELWNSGYKMDYQVRGHNKNQELKMGNYQNINFLRTQSGFWLAPKPPLLGECYPTVGLFLSKAAKVNYRHPMQLYRARTGRSSVVPFTHIHVKGAHCSSVATSILNNFTVNVCLWYLMFAKRMPRRQKGPIDGIH